MAELQTLNELDHLRNTEIGRPHPRHGLKLLYWFAKNCLYFDDNKQMCWRFDPDDGKYGFHLFENRYNINGDQLLPDKDLSYYEVGNLSKSGAGDLPKYVRKNYTSHHNESNKDRIIVSVDEEWFDEVYITEHQGQASYNADATYRISRGLLMIIQRLTLKDFLSDMNY